MILFTILSVLAVMFVVFALITVLAGGGAFILMFADVIICIGLVVLIVKFLLGRRKK